MIDLDDLEIREAVAGNLALVTGGRTPVCIDEYQRVPDILDAIKARLNREGSRPGVAVITGSTRQDALPATAQALTGRLHTVTIWPLSQGELAGTHENLLGALRADPAPCWRNTRPRGTTRDRYVARVCAGGLPLAVRRSEAARARWFDDFVRQSVERDAAGAEPGASAAVAGRPAVPVGVQTGQLLNITKAAEAVGVDRKTAEAHLRLLEDLFLVVRLPGWGKTLRSRVSVRPRCIWSTRAWRPGLLRLTPAKLATLDPAALTEFGNLLETFVVGELRKQASWLDEHVTLGHWRTSDGAEVDLVAEFDDGQVVAFEVKANQRATGTDFAGLQQLRDALGPRCGPAWS